VVLNTSYSNKTAGYAVMHSTTDVMPTYWGLFTLRRCIPIGFHSCVKQQGNHIHSFILSSLSSLADYFLPLFFSPSFILSSSHFFIPFYMHSYSREERLIALSCVSIRPYVSTRVQPSGFS